MDNKNKPKDQSIIDLPKEVKFKHKYLALAISPDNLEENAGKIIRFTCEKDNIVLTQKYYFIIIIE